MSPAASSDTDPIREIRRVHVMLEDWYGGIRDDVEPFAAAMARDFTSVGSDGTVRTREEALAAMAADREGYRDSSPPIAVDVTEIEHQREIYGKHLVTFRKRLRIDGEWDERRCSLWLRETDRSPSGLQWLHLHETPLPDAVDDRST